MKRSSCGKNGLISVIVPVYNAKQYLPDCLESLLSQTCPNLEILLVDDGSTDGSAEWIKAFIHSYEWKEGNGSSGSIPGRPAQDARLCKAEQPASAGLSIKGQDGKKRHIRLLQKENGGVSSARNLGLEEAKGDYISFVDADDWIQPEMLSEQLSCLLQHEADMAVSGFLEVGEAQRRQRRQEGAGSRPKETDGARRPEGAAEEAGAKGVRVLEPKAYVEDYLLCGNTRCWSVLYTRELIGSVRFKEGLSIGEDLLFLSKLLPALNRVCVLPGQDYCYYQNEGGAMFSGFKPSYMDQIRCWELVRPDMEQISARAAVRTDVCLFQGALLVAGKLALLSGRAIGTEGLYLKECRSAAQEAWKRLGAAGQRKLLPRGYRVKGRLFLRAPGLYLKLYHIWKGGRKGAE